MGKFDREVEIIASSGLFDREWYLSEYPDVRALGMDPIEHYLIVGAELLRDPSPEFLTGQYLMANADVRASGLNPLLHFVRHGRAEGRNPKPKDRTIPKSLLRFGNAEYGGSGEVIRYDANTTLAQGFSLTIGVHLHLFYADLADEFRVRLANIPAPFNLFISVASSGVDEDGIRARFEKSLPWCKNVVTRRVPNRGRDIGPFLVEFGSELKQFDLLLHLHSKRSRHSAHVDWRRFLLHYTLGSRSVVSEILNTFNEDRKVGIICPPYYGGVQSQPNWGKNRDKVIELLKLLNITLDDEMCPDYPAGSFFWVRTDAILPLLQAGLTLDAFPEETGQIDGTLAHAIERILGVLPLAGGYKKVSPYIDVAHNLVNLYTQGRTYPYFGVERTGDVMAYRAAVAARKGSPVRIAFVTAIFGRSDQVMLPEQLECDVDYFCVSNFETDSYGVFRIVEPCYLDVNLQRSVCFVKTHMLDIFTSYDYLVWIDANVLFRGRASHFVAELRASGHPIGAIPHPFRRTCYEEAAVCMEEKLDNPAAIARQMNRYRELIDRPDRLIETSFLIFDAKAPKVAEFQRMWWNEIKTFSCCDQLSVNYALHIAGVTWHPLIDERRSVRDADEFAIFVSA